MIAIFLVGSVSGIAITRLFYISHSDIVAPRQLTSARAPLPLPSLRELTVGYEDDDAAVGAVVDYFNANTEQLAILFKETNETRLKALYAMYLVHVSHIYAEVPDWPISFLAYVGLRESHCGTTAWAQFQLTDALGLTWRGMGLTGTHVWIEVLIDDHWEYFDGTINVWADKSAAEMEQGVARNTRAFYTPLLDAAYQDEMTPNALRAAQELRAMMPGYGLFYFPKAYLYVESVGNSEALDAEVT